MLPYYEQTTLDFFWFSSRSWQWHLDNPPEWSPHLHQHAEVVYMEQGEADLTVDGQIYRLHTGDVAVIFPHRTHSYRIVTKPGTPQTLRGICFLPSIAGEYGEQLLTHQPEQIVLSADTLSDELLYPLKFLFGIQWDDAPRIHAYLHLFLLLVWPMLKLRVVPSLQSEDSLHRTLRYVMENAHRPLQAQDVAEKMGISSSRLSRIFSDHVRMGFNEYVNLLRVRMAEDRLRDSDKTVTDIMNEVGFESQSTFNRAFRRVHGISPREYRQLTRSHLAMEGVDAP